MRVERRPFYRVREAAELVGVSDVTLRKYVREGRVECSRNPGNQRIFTLEQLAVLNPALLGETLNGSSVAFYLRASDGKQSLLDAQEELLRKKYGKPDFIVSDKASGLKEDRRGIKKLLRLAEAEKINTIYATEKDRLTRFGYDYLEKLFNTYGVEIIVLGNTKTKSPHDELIQDFLSLLTSFSGKYYRLRGHQQRRDFLQKVESDVT